MRPRLYKLLHAPVAVDSVAAWVRRYLEALAVTQISASTIQQRRDNLAIFHDWCLERDITTPRAITQAMLERFQKHLFYLRKADGTPLSVARQHQQLSAAQQWFRWLTRQGHLPADPSSGLTLPRKPRCLLPEALTTAEMERVFAVLDVGNLHDLRDRALLEVMYSTGIRRMEARNLTLYDIDPLRGTLFVRQGKGRKDRVVPIGERALAWVQKYLDEVRPQLVIDPKQTALFVSVHGTPLSLDYLTYRARECFQRAGIHKGGACHLLRHTMATLMLEHGADIRYIQEMLGHASLETTERYTHVTITKLKAIHAATHPGAKLERRAMPDADGVASNE